MKYRGSCHCDNVAFEAEGEIGELLACNCSMCRRKGLHPYAEATDREGKPIAAVNVRCIEGVDPWSFTVKHFDGAKL